MHQKGNMKQVPHWVPPPSNS